MDRIDALISGGISIVLAVYGVLLSRALSKIDESIQQLWIRKIQVQANLNLWSAAM